MRDDLPVRALAELEGGADTLVLCPTARLAGALRRAHGEARAARGETVWAALNGATPAQWLDHVVSSALLRGELPVEAVPGAFLTWPQERALWEQAVAGDGELVGSELFDRAGLAVSAMEAESLRAAWRLDLPDALLTDETRAFLRWRERLAEACVAGGWRTATEAMAWRIACVARGIAGLPRRIGLAGFVSPDPMLSRLLAVLDERGVELFRVKVGDGITATPELVACLDAEDECRAAAAWAAGRLAANPRARLRIAVADWPARRPILERALDAALHPQAVGAGWAALERAWAVAGGTPLADTPVAATALGLLRLHVQPRRVAQADVGALLRAPGWSADMGEADSRARLEAVLRERMPAETSLERLRRAVQRAQDTVPTPRLLADLDRLALVDVPRAPTRQTPGAWGEQFAALLVAVGWPGERAPLPVEQVARDRFLDVLAGLATLDTVLGRVDAATALRLTQQAARDQSVAPPRRGVPAVEVCALAEAYGGPVDGLWLMGLHEGAWPPAPRPNPLLPAEAQRRAGIPQARADSLVAQARHSLALWRETAMELVASHARSEGERALRASPLLDGWPMREAPSSVVDDARDIEVVLDALDDAKAPPVTEDEKLRGGTGLLQAQAVCPAWGFYRYRLGAAVLPAPTFGLDALTRGGLLHGALEALWRGRDLAWLRSLDDGARREAIAAAVAHALAAHDKSAVEPLSPRLRSLEEDRLRALLAVWLAVEAERADFRVKACEERHELHIEGLPVRVVVDRVDELPDGRLAILDYKSGRFATADSWADPRPSEPQLPIYAALVFPDRAVAAVALARVVADDPAFLGVAEAEGLLPGVKALDGQRRRYDDVDFPDWDSLRQAWAERIRELAREVKEGVAAVVFADEKAVAYCDVLPLLRVAERRAQFEEDA